MHLPVPDPRKGKLAKRNLAQHHRRRAWACCLRCVDSYEMQSLLDTEVLPMYEILDALKNKQSAGHPEGMQRAEPDRSGAAA